MGMKHLRFLSYGGLLASLAGFKKKYHCFASDCSPCMEKIKDVDLTFKDAIKKAEEKIKQKLCCNVASGAVMAVYVDGDRVHNKGYGWSDAENQAICNKDTKMRIGTLSMVFTAAQVLHYCQQNKVNLKTPLKPEDCPFQNNYRKLTLQNLLDHLSGVHPHECQIFLNKNCHSLHDQVRIALKKNQLEPGQFRFSLHNYNILGLFLQANLSKFLASKMPYCEVFKSQMRNLELRNTELEISQKLVPFFAKHYVSCKKMSTICNVSNRYPSSGIISTANDLAKFGNEILFHEQFDEKKDTRPFYPSIPCRMWKPMAMLPKDLTKGNNFNPIGYSFGWHVKLVPTMRGSRYKYTVLAYNEGQGISCSSVLAVRMGTNELPFPSDAENVNVARFENTTLSNSYAVNQNRERNTTRGIVVSIIMNGPELNVGPIAAELAEDIDKMRHGIEMCA